MYVSTYLGSYSSSRINDVHDLAPAEKMGLLTRPLLLGKNPRL
jgi:hypothetical protein